ncbi:MAG: family 43 glycosylhydrolase [Faecousia sp.]
MHFCSGKPQFDTSGNVIHAHGGGLLYENGIWYWYGENKERTDGKSGIWTWGINCYSSSDLENWKYEGLIIPPDTENTGSSLHPTKHVDRPHILYCAKTKKYVCWLKIGGKNGYFTILTADSICGSYTLVRDHMHPYGMAIGDFDLYRDANGNGYIYFAHDKRGVIAAQLTEDYLGVTDSCVDMFTGLKPPMTREGITHFIRAGKHYLLTSGMTSYVPNESEIAVSDTPLGPYKLLINPHRNDPSGASFNSQVSCIVEHPQYPGLFITLADRWLGNRLLTKKQSAQIRDGITAAMSRQIWGHLWNILNLPRYPLNADNVDTSLSTYVWLPLTFEEDTPVIHCVESWDIKEFIK